MAINTDLVSTILVLLTSTLTLYHASQATYGGKKTTP